MSAEHRESFVSRVGFATGIITPLHLIGVASFSIPLFVGVTLGVFTARAWTPDLASKYQRMYVDYAIRSNTNPWILNALAQFTISATITMLSELISLMATSLVVTMPVNPFVWPALIAGGICAGIIFALYWYAHREEQSRSQGFVNVSWRTAANPPPATSVPLAQGYRQFQPEPEVSFTIEFIYAETLDFSEMESYWNNVKRSENKMSFTVPQSKQETTMAYLAMQSVNIFKINGQTEQERLAAAAENRI